MSTDLPRLSAVSAADAVVWALEHVSRLVHHELDPSTTREEARRSVGASPALTKQELVEAFRSAGRTVRLATTPVKVTPAELATGPTPFPLLAAVEVAGAVAWWLVSERRGTTVVVLRGAEETVMDEAALRSALGDAPTSFLHCVPATPMESLSAASHSAHAVVGGDDGEDPHHMHLRPWDRVKALLALERDDVWVVVIYSAAVGVLTLATPIAVQSLVGTVAFGTLLQPIVVLALLFLVALGFQSALKALETIVIETLQARFFARVSLDVAYRLPRVQRDEAHPVTPELVNRFFDVPTVQKSLATVLTDGLEAVMQIVIGLLVLAFYHPALLALDLVLVTATLLLVLLPLRRGVRTAFDESKYKYALAAWLQELARAPAAFRGTGGSALASARADALTREYLSARRRHFSVIFGQTVSALAVHVVASAVLLGFGGYLVVNQSLTLGQLIAAELIVGAVTLSITKFGKILEASYDLVVGLAKVGHLIDLEIDTQEAAETFPGAGPLPLRLSKVEVDGQAISLEVSAGAKVALVGARGGALGELLAGVSRPSSGAYEVNGVDVRRARSVGLHDVVALVRVDDLFAGTLQENVSLTRPGVTPAEVRAAIERVGLEDDVRALPDGYETELGERGAPLSQSQALRLVVARALASNPRLIIVDDTLDSLDPVARSRAVAALTRRDAPWTLVALVSDPASALARACGDVRDLATLSTPAEAKGEASTS
jgi:putative ABC transport system ATP-binding protein